MLEFLRAGGFRIRSLKTAEFPPLLMYGQEIATVEVKIMLNRYPAPCRHCGGTVPANGGTVEKVGESWKTAHPGCVSAQRNDTALLALAADAPHAKRACCRHGRG